jgi:hypothetical protein
MQAALTEVSCARLSPEYLGVLAELRCLPDVRVRVARDQAWVYWPGGDEQMVQRLLPVPGVVLFHQRGEAWYRFGHLLPTQEVPAADGQPLSLAITPAPVSPQVPGEEPLSPVRLHLVPSEQVRPTTAMICALADLAAWAESVSGIRLASLEAVYRDGEVLLRGAKLPVFARGERFWGDDVLVPLGWRVEPDLPSSAVREALALDDEIALVRADGFEVLPRDILQPLTRVSIRLAGRNR